MIATITSRYAVHTGRRADFLALMREYKGYVVQRGSELRVRSLTAAGESSLQIQTSLMFANTGARAAYLDAALGGTGNPVAREMQGPTPPNARVAGMVELS
jgi:hypothetical protein